MRDLLSTELFGQVVEFVNSLATRIQEASLLHLSAPASIEGMLALGQLEAVCLDLGLKYTRKFTATKADVPRDESIIPTFPKNGLGVFCNVEEEVWKLEEVPATPFIHILPLQTQVETGTQRHLHTGVLDPVVLAAAIAAHLAPNGRRVRALRPFISLGLWQRGALDTRYDPIHSLVIAHLQHEGSLRMVPLPEVEQAVTEMIPGFSQRQYKRLVKSWSGMHVDQRAMALSELILTSLTHNEISTPRLEELTWHRMVIRGQPQDVVSQLFRLETMWPKDLKNAKIFASKILDFWLASGSLAYAA